MLESIGSTPWYWWVVGFGGQAAFSARFLIQWLASEREGRSIVPTSFWYLSLVGGNLLLAYAIFRFDPVFILAQGIGSVVYARNLQLLARQRNVAS